MKNNRSIPDSRRFYSSILFYSILFFFSIQPVNAQILEGSGLIPYQMDWNVAGLLPTTPTVADHLIIISDMAGATWDEKIQNAINLAVGQTGITIIYFPGGIYELTQPVNLSYSDNEGNIIFRGAGSTATILQFNIGNNGVCFNVEGTCGAPYSINNNINMYANTFVCSATTFDVGDWVHFRERTFPTEDGADVGQLTQIAARDLPNHLYTIKDIAAKVYSTLYTLEVIEAFPITNVGIENLWIWRKDTGKSTENQFGCGHNIKFSYALNCWIKGVQMDFTCRHHISIARSSHLEISGCYIHDAVDHGENDYGYGISLSSASTNCLIENNIFRMVRHAMGVGGGANSNCFVYNFSTEQYSTYNGIPYDDADICLHGRYSFSNLYEHNYVEWIEADTEHGDNGPYNAFFRNYVSRENNIQLDNAPCSSVEGCESIPSGVYINMYSIPLSLDRYGYRNGTPKSHLEASSYPRSDFVLGDVSYYYSVTPDFLGSVTFPSIGPKRTSGSPLPTNDIPARIRYYAKNYTYLSQQIDFPATMPQTFSTGTANLNRINQDMKIWFFDNKHPVLANECYVCDVYELKADPDFCPSYSTTPHVWLNQTGYTIDNPNLSNFILYENSTTSNSHISTYFYYIKRIWQGSTINKWSPYDPTAISPQYIVMGIPGVMTANGSLTHDETWCGTHTITGNITVPSGVQLTILGGTTINFSGSSYITVQPGGSIVASSPITFNPGDRSVRYSGTMSVNNTWAFPVLMTDNVTVNSGKMLTILPGALIKVYSGKKLTVNGTISASGTSSQKITFQANSGTWYGIEVNYGGYTAFNYSIIKNATCGIRGYQTSNLTLDHCEITNNTNGVTYTNQSSGYVRYSKINSNMGNSGINCAQNSNPIVRPNNQLKYNTPAGLYGDYNSLPEMGSWANNGNNSISNSYDDVWSENSNSVYALYNYWGSSSPNPGVSDNIEWEPYLTSDPNGGSLHKLLAENPVTADRDTTGQTEFAKAYQTYLKEDYALAIPLFQEIVQKYPDHANGGQALGLINQCYQKTEKNTDALSYLEQVQSRFTDKKVSQLARSIAVGHLVRQGDYATAIANCEQILAASPDSTLNKYALYDLGNIYWYFQHDPKTGEKYYRQLIETWPKDQLAQSALATLGEATPDTPRKPQPADAAAVVTDHLTLQTFPNPFNPITAIQFNLPEAGQVTITIYDLQGRQITCLLDEPREAGLQIVRWNGQNEFGVPAASGTYFCQLQFKNQVLNQKIILLK